ncbi:MAG TPA: sigma-54 dependent transcriptional regulator [Myxococcota bacterium]|nr:sigma-54 dependent transcriptional regulator [Myxococcota bacterium]
MTGDILVVDDEELIRWSLEQHLTRQGHRVRTAPDGQAALERLAEGLPDVVVLDLRMPRLDGMGVLQAIRERGWEVPVVMLTAFGGFDSAVEATKLGATAFLAKPFDLDEVSRHVDEAIANARKRCEVVFQQHKGREGFEGFIGSSASLSHVFDTLERLRQVDAPTVLLLGESGTGKDVIARLIWQRGPRRTGPFMDIDCASLPEQLIESELFGHERGAFTDARATKQGLFEVAAGGVVFLDELGEMPLGTQSKLLRALESRTFRRVGGVTSLPMNVALIAATNRNLAEEVKAGRFREDLYFRLNVVPITLPALRERRDDVPLLASFFLDRCNASFGRRIRGFTAEAMERMARWRWPGNVRELRNVIERLVLLVDGDIVRAENLPPEIRWAVDAQSTTSGCPFVLPPEGVDLEAVDRGLLVQALQRTQGNQSAAARLLGISRYALRYRMEKYGMLVARGEEEAGDGA